MEQECGLADLQRLQLLGDFFTALVPSSNKACGSSGLKQSAFLPFSGGGVRFLAHESSLFGEEVDVAVEKVRGGRVNH